VVRVTVASEAVLWHDVECGAYAADLPLWRELAAAAGGPLLELGCGTGRVALDLAARGHDVTALDSDPELVAALAARARDRGLRVQAEVADARSFSLEREFALAIAPMQVIQLLGGSGARESMLRAVRRGLVPGGLLAGALADPFEGVPAEDALLPLPDMLERDGWVYSSAPLSVREERGATVIARVRQAVSPAGELTEALAELHLDRLDATQLERAAEPLGFRALPRRQVPPTPAYVGSSVVILEAR
jgi:SAM-dependent methyltransferase